MRRALQLASKGRNTASPNPMVGCVIVKDERIIGEGWHFKAGQAHAEVMAIRSVKQKEDLKDASMYVSLEPCSHHGRTPPCSELIIQSEIPRVFICNLDPNPLVSGRGKQLLVSAGVHVTNGVLESEGEFLNRRFFHFHRRKRPYFILKWAQSADGFMDVNRKPGDIGSFPISGKAAHRLSHLWRSTEDAILVGRRTVEVDRPSLTSRHYRGRNPIRFVIDSHRKLNGHQPILEQDGKCIRFSSIKGNHQESGFDEEVIGDDIFEAITEWCVKHQVLSVLIEGGAETLKGFIARGMWNEFRVFQSMNPIGGGLKAPELPAVPDECRRIGSDELFIGYNK